LRDAEDEPVAELELLPDLHRQLQVGAARSIKDVTVQQQKAVAPDPGKSPLDRPCVQTGRER
jgi:hypothetical protein